MAWQQLYPRRVQAIIGLVLGVAAVLPARAGDIAGRRENMFGHGTHESIIWAVGAGYNTVGHHGMALSWLGDYAITGLPAGQYYLVGNAHGPAPHNIFDTPITVPATGTIQFDLRDRITMSTEGLTDLGQCSRAAQTFIATGRDIDEVVVITPNGGSRTRISIRDGGPDGPQIGPAKVVENGSLFPAAAHWGIGEVPVIPGRRYAVLLEAVSPSTWTPAVGYRMNRYPNGHAWIDGVPLPEADLKIDVACRDSGFIIDYETDGWWRNRFFHELVQTFVPRGEELRVAQMMLASDSGYVFRASLHEWNGSYPPGPQVGDAKHAVMSKNVPQAFIWGPGEAVLVPGHTYALRFVRNDGRDFAIYGDADNYAQGRAYFDGTAESGIDMFGNFVTREIDRGNIHVSDLTVTPISATEVRATFQTDVPTTATIAYATGTQPFDSMTPASQTPATSHEIIANHLSPGATYDVWVVAHHPDRNVLADRAMAVSVTTPNERAALTGRVYSQVGPVAGAEVILENPHRTTFTGADGMFSFDSVSTGRRTLTVRAVGHAGTTQEVDVTADGLAHTELTMTAHGNLLAGTDANPMAGWTAYGHLNGEFNNGDWGVATRTGPKWIGYVANWPDMSAGDHVGGIYRTITVEPGKRYRFAGYVMTNAYGSDHDPIIGLATARIGIDVSGGTDPAGPDVIWTRYRFTDGEWKEHVLEFTPTGTAVTLFTQHRWEYFYETPVWFIAGYDDLWLGTPEAAQPDFDRDGDVDQEDFGFFQACMSGAGIEQTRPACMQAMLDADEDVDHDDFAIFSGCMSGAGIAYDPNCVRVE